MRAETIILSEGFSALREKLNIVETEKFISLISKEKFDYTEWQRNLWDNKSVDEIFYAAKAYIKNNENSLLSRKNEKSKDPMSETAINSELPRRKIRMPTDFQGS